MNGFALRYSYPIMEKSKISNLFLCLEKNSNIEASLAQKKKKKKSLPQKKISRLIIKASFTYNFFFFKY